MAERNVVTSLTAQNATETTKTLVGNVTVPQGVTKLKQVMIQIVAKGFTTLESVATLIEIESDDAAPWNGTQSFLSDVYEALTSGAASLKPTIHDCDIAVSPGSTLKVSSTYVMALTINPSTRVGLKFA